MKVVINTCFGGFGLSVEAAALYCERSGANPKDFYDRDVKRDNPLLVAIVEELGERANGDSGELCIVNIPDGVAWEIEEYDGLEHIAEQHRTWR